MTNIVPQSGPLNQKAWNSLEIYCRGLVEKEGKRLYIVCGPQGTGGVGTKGPADTIARGKVNVPAKCWKIILVLPEDGGENDMAKVTKRTRVIAVVMPNDQEVGFGWAHFRTSVKKVEELTGYTFFDKVPADIAGALKEKVDEVHIPRVRPPRRPR
jgi:endonuclease G